MQGPHFDMILEAQELVSFWFTLEAFESHTTSINSHQKHRGPAFGCFFGPPAHRPEDVNLCFSAESPEELGAESRKLGAATFSPHVHLAGNACSCGWGCVNPEDLMCTGCPAKRYLEEFVWVPRDEESPIRTYLTKEGLQKRPQKYREEGSLNKLNKLPVSYKRTLGNMVSLESNPRRVPTNFKKKTQLNVAQEWESFGGGLCGLRRERLDKDIGQIKKWKRERRKSFAFRRRKFRSNKWIPFQLA